jgi:taurine dioxygenase
MFSVRKLGQTLGAEVTGLDLSKPLSDADFEKVKNVFYENSVIVIRGQKLTPEQHLSFSRRFGTLDVNVRKKFNKPGYDEIFVVSNVLVDGKPIGVQDAGRFWHTDLCYVTHPSSMSLLYAIEIPIKEDGVALGDTLFSSVTAAYDALPDDIKQRLDGKKAINSYNYTYESKVQKFSREPLTEEQKKNAPPDIAHPLIRTHPVTGKKCIFVNEGYSTQIVGMPETDGKAMLSYLFDHVVKPDFLYRHRWQVGDLLMWDNCAVQHKAVFDYALPLRRYMERTTITGTVPF